MEELTADERLALLIAIDKQVKPALDDAKSEARDALMAAHEADGTERRAILVGGSKVGTVGVSYSKPRYAIVAGREGEALEWLGSHGLTKEVPVDGWERVLGARIGDAVADPYTGEVLEWVVYEPQRASRAQVRGCEPADVADAFGARLTGDVAMLALEGGI